jgi:serine/threonine-protein kinase
MEYLEGDDLWMRLQRVGRLSPGDTYVIASQIARGLCRAHGAGIIHRDLKPENVFLAKEGDETIVKLLDFGIAKWTVSPFDEGDGLIGTPEYMSPEQARGALEVDYRADLWALAVIVYQCLTGTLPFTGETVAATLAQVTAGAIPVPSRVAPGVPAGFDLWWAHAAAPNIDDRFQGAPELAEALGKALGFSSGRAEEATAPQYYAAPAQAIHRRLPSPVEPSSFESSTTLSYRPHLFRNRRARIAAPAAGLVAALVALLAGAWHDQASVARANLARRVQAIESPAASRAATSRVEAAAPTASPSETPSHELPPRPARVTRSVRAARPHSVVSSPPPPQRVIDPSPRIEPAPMQDATVPKVDVDPPWADPPPKKEQDAVDFGI